MNNENLRGLDFDNIIVEDSPDVNLDDFFEDDENDLIDLNTEEDTLPNTSSDIETLDVPHFTIPLKAFVDVLKALSTLVSGKNSGTRVDSKFIDMIVTGDNLKIHLSSNDCEVVKEIKLLNKENRFPDFICINLPIISKLINVSNKKYFTILKDTDGKFYMKGVGANYALETLKSEGRLSDIKDENTYKDYGTLTTSDLLNSIKSMFPVISSAITPAQRRLFAKGKEFTSGYLHLVSRYKCSAPIPSFDLDAISCKIIHIFSNSLQEDTLKILANDKRYMISCDGFKFTWHKTEFRPNRVFLDSMDNVLNSPNVDVMLSQIKDIAKVSSELNYSSTRLEFNFTEKGKLFCIMKTKLNDTSIDIKANENKECSPLDSNIGVTSPLLFNLLNVFTQNKTVKLHLHSHGVGISNDKFEAVLYKEGIGRVN